MTGVEVIALADWLDLGGWETEIKDGWIAIVMPLTKTGNFTEMGLVGE